MGVYEELVERGLIAQTTDEEHIRDLVNNGKAVFYIGFDPTADSLHVGHFIGGRQQANCTNRRRNRNDWRPVRQNGYAPNDDKRNYQSQLRMF